MNNWECDIRGFEGQDSRPVKVIKPVADTHALPPNESRFLNQAPRAEKSSQAPVFTPIYERAA